MILSCVVFLGVTMLFLMEQVTVNFLASYII